MPKFQGKGKSLLQGYFAIEKRMKFLQQYMTSLLTLNDTDGLKMLFNCALFEDFIDLMSHHEIRRKILKQLNDEVSNSPN